MRGSGSPSAIGSAVTVNHVPLTITGIMHYSTFDNSSEGGLAPHTVILPRTNLEVVISDGCE